jgi:hypothetical protein
MNTTDTLDLTTDVDEPLELVTFDFCLGAGEGFSRRAFVQALGAGLLIAVLGGG